jgi:hypothetical protein
LPFEIVLGVWNFSVLLQNVCFDELNVYRLWKLYIHVICVGICICLCFSLKINKLQKKKYKKQKKCHTSSIVNPVTFLQQTGWWVSMFSKYSLTCSCTDWKSTWPPGRDIMWEF